MDDIAEMLSLLRQLPSDMRDEYLDHLREIAKQEGQQHDD